MSHSPHESNRARHWVCALQIAERRHQLGLTQQDVVDRLAVLGVSATNRTLSAMEHGQGIDIGRMPELAIALDCTVTYLLGLTAHPLHWVPDEGSLPSGTADTGVPTWLTANLRPSLHRFTERVPAVAEEIGGPSRVRRA